VSAANVPDREPDPALSESDDDRAAAAAAIPAPAHVVAAVEIAAAAEAEADAVCAAPKVDAKTVIAAAEAEAEAIAAVAAVAAAAEAAEVAAEAAAHRGERADRPQQSSNAQRLQALRANARLLMVLVLSTVLYTCYLASSLLLPVVLAGFFALLLAPLMRRAPLRWLPRGISALLLVVGLIAGLGAIGTFIAGPAGDWARKVPFVLREAAPKLREMVKPLQQATAAGKTLDTLTGDSEDAVERVVVRPPSTDLLSATPRVVGSLLAVLLLTFSFLVYGDDLLAKMLALRPTRAHRSLTMGIVNDIQSELSRYMLTICATSVVLGAATAAWLFWLGVEDPLLWGTLAALLNLTPFVGPLAMMVLLTLVGLSQFDSLGAASLPFVGFLVLHGLESQVLTPLALGKTMHLNPLAIILWLMVWGWLWGVVGLLVAVPMLVCVKIFASRVRGWEHWARLLE
jgi:predicted PurR-regulated permease PerM